MYDQSVKIEVTREPNEDASAAAKRAADAAGTKIAGNLRWYGEYRNRRECAAADGRSIVVHEPTA